MYEIFEHTADLGLQVRAASREQLFADAARGLFAMLVLNLDDVAPRVERRFQLEGDQWDYLLFDWLNELLYTFESEKLLLSEFEVRFDGTRLEAVARGEPLDWQRHQMDHEVKAITYHDLLVEQREGGWFAELIVDI